MLITNSDYVRLFHKLNDKLKQFKSCSVVILGGDCTTHAYFTCRNTGEPHQPSASLLFRVITQNYLTDVWRNFNPTVKQYTWIKV